MLTSRQTAILRAAVEEYIQTARPVGSSAIAQRLSQNLSPATIRAVLLKLEAEGFLYQPHTSAGRIPTDHGYRYYVDHVRERHLAQRERDRIEHEYAQLKAQYQHLARATAELVAALTQTVVVSRVNQARASQVAGLRELFALPEVESISTAKELSRVIEALSDSIVELSQVEEDAPQVYIGHEIPFYQAEHTSLMAQRVRAPNGEQVTVVVVGPKRMAYQRNAALLGALSEIISEHETYDETK